MLGYLLNNIFTQSNCIWLMLGYDLQIIYLKKKKKKLFCITSYFSLSNLGFHGVLV